MNEWRKENKYLSGFISGSMASLCVWPLETIKIQKQAVHTNSLSLRYAILNIYHQHGILGFYRGVGYGMLSNSIFYGVYFNMIKYLKTNCNSTNDFINAYISAGVGSIFINLFQIYKTQRQVQAVVNPSKSLNCFKGLGWTLCKNVELGIISTFRPKLHQQLVQHGPNFMNDSIIGWSTSTFIIKWMTNTLLYPLDTGRVISRTSSYSTQKIIWTMFQNPKIAYRGYILYSIRSVPSTVIAFTINDLWCL